MTRDEVLAEVKKYFSIDELVCNHALSKWGERAWQFLDTTFLENLIVVRRDILKAPMWSNNHKKGVYQRGLGCNRCQMVTSKSSVYLSAHCLGKAADFTVEGMTAEQARLKIKANASLLPHPIRLEKGVTWLHMDTLPQCGVSDKVYLFTA